MNNKLYSFILCAGLIVTPALHSSYASEQPEIAITIDDLPFVGSGGMRPSDVIRTQERFMRLLNVLVENKIPTTGFVIAGSIGKNWDLLQAFQKEGFLLGNHTYSHPSLNGLTADKYIENIDKADHTLSDIISTPKYFRYPYLAESKGEKKAKVQQYLTEHGYTIAPVTIDTKDYRFNAQLLAINWRLREQKLDSVKKRYLDYILSQTEKAEQKAAKSGQPAKQILLIHANLLNSYCLGDIIELYKQRGYKFISLEEALKRNNPSVINPINAKLPNKNNQAAIYQSFKMQVLNDYGYR